MLSARLFQDGKSSDEALERFSQHTPDDDGAARLQRWVRSSWTKFLRCCRVSVAAAALRESLS
jgi:hypothetical protein